MVELFEMWAMVEALGLICLPLTITVCHNLPDRGWAFSKTIGVALLAFCVWLPLMSIHLLPFSQFFILGIVLIILACNLLGFWRTYHTIIKMVRRNISYIIVTEAVFVGMVLLLGWLRSYRPDIRNFEMFMDEGFLAAIMRSPHLPPNDMWLAGYSINYYYYAHFTIAVLAKLLGQIPSIAFNTGISVIFGLTAVNLFGVTCNVVSWARHVRAHARTQPALPLARPDQVYPPLPGAMPYGLFTIVMGLVLGNLAATQQWWENHGDGLLQAHFDWFGPSRVIEKTINEFPAFSFLLSCFHAHTLTLAFTILAVGLAFNLYLERGGKALFVFGRGWSLPLTLGTTALVLGGLFAMNGWDFPTYLGITLICIALQQWLAHQSRFSLELVLDVLTAGAVLTSLSVFLFVPFYVSFISPSQGIGIVGPGDRSQFRDELLIYGLFAFLFLSLLVKSALNRLRFAYSPTMETLHHPQPTTPRPRLGLGLVGILLIVVLVLATLRFVQNSTTLVVAASIALSGIVLVLYNIRDHSHAFTLLLGAVAFGLVAFCEVFFLKDVFAGNYPRMNTVFKFYFQAWALLSIASGCGLFFLLEHFWRIDSVFVSLRWLQRSGRALWAMGLLALVLASTAYPLLAPPARLAHYDFQVKQLVLTRSNSLDGLTYLQNCRPPDLDPDPVPFCTYDVSSDYAAIRWINANIQGDPVIVEATGNDYSLYGRVSAFTGLPTIMGWVGHEYQWRVNWLNNALNAADFYRRTADIDAIYTSPDANLVLTTMARYQARYLYVGPLERIKYPHVNLQRFSAFMQVVYNAAGVTIYKVA
jgi:YYY domain-containing protein